MKTKMTLALAASMFALTLGAFPHYASARPTATSAPAPSPAAIDIFLVIDDPMPPPPPPARGAEVISDLFVVVPYIYWGLLASR
jgi:hypothetical protein